MADFFFSTHELSPNYPRKNSLVLWKTIIRQGFDQSIHTAPSRSECSFSDRRRQGPKTRALSTLVMRTIPLGTGLPCFLIAAATHSHKWNGFQQHDLIIGQLQSQKSEMSLAGLNSRGTHGCVPSGGSRGQSPSLPLAASRGCLPALAFSTFKMHYSNLCFQGHIAFSNSAFVVLSPPLTPILTSPLRSLVITLGSRDNPGPRPGKRGSPILRTHVIRLGPP